MKLIFTTALFAISISAYSNDICEVGFKCEQASNGDFILRETRLIQDESLKTCQVETILNLGPNEDICVQIATERNL